MKPLPKRIFLVEDDLSQLRLMTAWLRLAGHEVIQAADGKSAIERLRTARFDLILSDIELPQASGIEVLAAAKKHSPDTPACLLTARELGSAVSAAVDLGVDAYLIKPLSRPVLLARVDELLAKAAARQAARPSVLAIGAHPDDVEIGCGGALLAHAADGAEIAVLTLSSGARGGAASDRRRESQRAAERLGAVLVTGDLPDTAIRVDGGTISLIEHVIGRVQPTLVYTHSRNDLHQDHRAAHDATMVAARQVPELVCYQSPSSTIAFEPNRFVDVGPHIDEKLALLACYESQVSSRRYLNSEFVRATALYWGRHANFGMVEPLEVIREARTGVRKAS